MYRQRDSSQSPSRPAEAARTGTKTRMLAAISRILAGSRATPRAAAPGDEEGSDRQVEWALRLMS